MRREPSPNLTVLALLAVVLASGGCRAFLAPAAPLPVTPPSPSPESDVPRELAKVSLPPYVIEPPDVLTIDAVKIVPKPPHLIETFDILSISATNTLLDQPIFGQYQVDADGRVDLGMAYGKVSVIGLTIDEARTAVKDHLSQILAEPEVSLALAATSGVQQIAGLHLVGLDGTISLGVYGNVYVAGMTIEEATEAVEKHLSQFLDEPEVMVDIFSYSSKFYYVITEGAGLGDNVQRLPIFGNETVLDAVALIGGLSQLSSTNIWISRPSPNGVGCEQYLPVDWGDITRGGLTATNYQLLPGDRLFIAQDKLVAFDTLTGKITAPFERLFGFTILGSQMINRVRNAGQSRRFF